MEPKKLISYEETTDFQTLPHFFLQLKICVFLNSVIRSELVAEIKYIILSISERAYFRRLGI